VVTIAFQSAFHLKIYRNNIFFYFLKFIFDISTLKYSKNTKKLILSKEKNKKILNFFKRALKMQKQTGFKYGYNHV